MYLGIKAVRAAFRKFVQVNDFIWDQLSPTNGEPRLRIDINEIRSENRAILARLDKLEKQILPKQTQDIVHEIKEASG